MIPEKEITDRLAEEIQRIENTYSLLQKDIPEYLEAEFTNSFRRSEIRIQLLSWILDVTPRYKGMVNFFCSGEINGNMPCKKQCVKCGDMMDAAAKEIEEEAYCKKCMAPAADLCMCEVNN